MHTDLSAHPRLPVHGHGRGQAVLSGFAAASMLGFAASGVAAGVAWPYYVGVAGAAGHMAWQLRSVDLRNGRDCMDKFVSNKYLGGIMFAGAVLGRACM